MTKGAIFCHVNIINLVFQEIPSRTGGNQKWKGAAPILRRRAELRRTENEQIKLFERILRIEKIKIIEARVWEEKYFIIASEENLLLNLNKIGMIDKRFISNPIHIPIHEEAEIEINVLKIKKLKNTILLDFIIKKKRGAFIGGVWTHKLNLAYLFIFKYKMYRKFWIFRGQFNSVKYNEGEISHELFYQNKPFSGTSFKLFFKKKIR